MTLSLNTATSTRTADILDQDNDQVQVAVRPELYLVPRAAPQTVQAQKRTAFRLRSYLPTAYNISQPRSRRAGSYA